MNSINVSMGFSRKARVGFAVGFICLSASWTQALDIATRANGFWDNTNTWNSFTIPTNTDNVTILTNHTVTCRDLVERPVSNLTINGGGILTHSANNTSETYKVILNVGGDLTIATNGRIDATGVGYTLWRGPAPGLNNTYGASHGGLAYGPTPYSTYGSITAPTNLGSGASYAGGGAVSLRVAGQTILDGMIMANGPSGVVFTAASAGGSVYLTTATLAGSGTIGANGSIGNPSYGSGGGRIAVKLTTGNDFGSVSMAAYGSATNSGAAGTIYRETASQAAGKGELIIDGGGLVPLTGAATLVHPALTGLPTGNITVRQYGRLLLTNVTLVATNCAVSIHANGTIELRSGAVLDLTGGTLGGTGTSVSATLKLTGGSLLTSPNFAYSNLSLWVANPSTFYPSTAFTIGSNASFIADVPLTFSNLTVGAGGVVTHSANAASDLFRLDLTILGSMNVETNGRIDATGKGYMGGGGSAGYGPAPGLKGSYGASHGGLGDGLTPYSTYGSITAPTNLGSGGTAYSITASGGGAVILRVTGNTTINGTIGADGQPNYTESSHVSSAGGSVWLTTATLAGSGTINAKGGWAGASYFGGGGGRIAVDLTAGESFDNVTMLACGTTNGTSFGAAGTVYRETASQGPGRGELVVDNAGRAAGGTATTQVSSNMTGKTVGTVVIRNAANLGIAANQSLVVNGSWSNGASFTASAGSTVFLSGTNAATVYGISTFQNLTCTNGGKQLSFQADKTNAVQNALTLNGALNGSITNGLVLRSTSTSAWYFNMAAGKPQNIQYVDVKDSNARGGTPIAAYDSMDSGNNTNWIFGTAGQTNAWTGATSTNWATAGNWSLGRATLPTDVVLITNGCPRYPTLDTIKTVATLIMNNAASLRLGGFDMTIPGNATLAGSLIPSGAETITFSGNLDFTSGVFSQGTTRVVLNGTNAQTIISGGIAYNALIVTNTAGTVTFTQSTTANAFTNQGGTVTFADTVAITTFVNNSGNLSFATNTTMTDFHMFPTGSVTVGAGAVWAVTYLSIQGTPAGKIGLRSAAPGSRWRLNVRTWNSMAYVDAQDSDASPGLGIYPMLSTDSGNNTNWFFGDSGNWKRWNGSVSTSFTNGANWTPTGAPDQDTLVLVDGFYVNAPRLTNALTLRGLTVGGVTSATLTVEMPLTVRENLNVLQNGVVTHTANNTSELYKVDITVSGNLGIDAGGMIDVKGKGYASFQGPAPGDLNGARWGASYGGLGDTGPNPYSTYGSITAPTNLGSGGADWSYLLSGGGAAILRVMGGTVFNGVIRADGRDAATWNAAAAGGSVYLTTATLAGSGTITAKGSDVLTSGYVGGGGRIAVKLTAGESFDNVRMLAYGTTTIGYGAAGTVYRETSSQGPGRGALVIDNGGYTVSGVGCTLISTNVTGTAVGTVLIRNAAILRIATNQWLTVNGSWSNGASFTADTNSTVSFDGNSTATLYGNSAFYNLRSVTRKKNLVFQAGRTNTVQGMLQLNGVVLSSTVSSNYWYLRLLTGGTQDVQRVTVSDSNATNGQTIVATKSVDLGHNVNWNIIAVSPGTVFILH